MKIRLAVAGSLLVVSMLASAETKTYEYPRAEALPEDSTSVFPRDRTLLTGHDINLSAGRLLDAWNNKGNERERIKADMYFLGVLDASEGKEWCEYHDILPGSAHEYIYTRLTDMNAEQRKQRASTFIIESMKDMMPCNRKRKK